MSKRTQQVADEMRRILSEVVQYELQDPRVGFATVVGVEMSADLQHAWVHVSVMGSKDEQRTTMRALGRARGFLRRRVAQELRHLRSVPELHIKLDESLEHSVRIDEVLRQVTDEHAGEPERQDKETGRQADGEKEQAE